MANVTVDVKHDGLIKALVSKGNLFTYIYSLYNFAASYGYSKKRFVKTEKVRERVTDKIYENSKADVNIYAIALAHEKDMKILDDKDRCYEIYEGYVNGGLEEIQSISDKFPDETLFRNEILNQITSQAQKNTPKAETEANLDNISFDD